MQPLSKHPIFILLVLFAAAAVATGISVWPLPSNYSTGNDVLWVAEDVRFTYKVLRDSVTIALVIDGFKMGIRC